MPNTNGDAQLEQLAQISNELITAETILDSCVPTSMHAFNALTASDAFITTKRHASLIERLEATSTAADTLCVLVSKLVKALRDEKRALTKSVGSAINSPAMVDAENDLHANAARPVKKRKAESQPTA